LIREVLGAVSEYERSMVVLRLRTGRRRKAETGSYAEGQVPSGYRADKSSPTGLVPEPEEQKALALMRGLGDQGASLPQIVHQPEPEGIPRERGHPRLNVATVSRFGPGNTEQDHGDELTPRTRQA
jgi:hypothetical protein